MATPKSQKSQGRMIDKVKMIDYPGMLLSLGGVIFLLVCELPLYSHELELEQVS